MTIRFEPLGLVDDERDEAVAAGLVEREVVAAEGLGGAVDGGERRAELVRGRGDEVGLQLLEPAGVGDVAERVDVPPKNSTPEIEIQRSPRAVSSGKVSGCTGSAAVPTGMLSAMPLPAGDRLAGRAARSPRPRAGR